MTPKLIAAEAGMDFRYVRVLLRDRYGKRHKNWSKWEFTHDEAREIVRWLKTRPIHKPWALRKKNEKAATGS
jgi:hypothetical protein